VEDSSGHVVVAPINVSKSTNSKTFTELPDSLNVNKTLAKGTYTLVVTVTNTTSNKIGGWKNTSPYPRTRSISRASDRRRTGIVSRALGAGVRGDGVMGCVPGRG
jgi:hypothetical protein